MQDTDDKKGAAMRPPMENLPLPHHQHPPPLPLPPHHQQMQLLQQSQMHQQPPPEAQPQVVHQSQTTLQHQTPPPAPLSLPHALQHPQQLQTPQTLQHQQQQAPQTPQSPQTHQHHQQQASVPMVVGSSSGVPVSVSQKFDQIVTFPWSRDSSSSSSSNCYHGLDQNVKPGEYVLLTLFMEFCSTTERKIEQVLAEPLKNHFSRSLQRSEDTQFDQLLTSLGCVAEQGLPSLLSSLIKWYDKQSLVDEGHLLDRYRIRNKGEKNFLCERRELAVDYVYCLVLIEILPKLSYHPGHDGLVSCIINQSFRHFKYKDGLQANPNSSNIKLISSLYAEVIGVLAQSRFPPIRKTFLNELRELKLRDQTPFTAQSVISLLMGLKFFRVKMHPMEDFEMCVQFLHELGQYFLEVKDRDIKHALAMLLVEILLPVAAQAKNEVNVPVLKNFVEMLYSTTIDMTTKKKHTLHLFPLVTCLLCVSQKPFFLSNWPYFLTMCLSQLKNKEVKMSRVALESLYRLLWVYMVRVKCESNTATRSRLQSIVNSLFPKGSKMVTPRDTPLNIFVKIIQFIAKERLDFAVKEIIFDLLCVGRPIKFLTPERMSIGLRAFLVIADSLQQKDGDPPMPQSAASLPSGSTVRIKRTFLNKLLSEETARNIGLSCYYPHILKTFDSILRALDLQVGRALLHTNPENAGKEVDEVITSDRKPKIDLFRTCIAAIPRLIPENMGSVDLVELLTRLTVHIDDELKGLAFQALQNLMHESRAFKEQVIRGFVQFVQREVSDTTPQLLDGALRMLVQLLVQWKSNPNPQQLQQQPQSSQNLTHPNNPNAGQQSVHHKKRTTSLDHPTATGGGGGGGGSAAVSRDPVELSVLHDVEGLALVMLCSIRLVTRKLALLLLKEVRSIFSTCQHSSSATCANCSTASPSFSFQAQQNSANPRGTTTQPQQANRKSGGGKTCLIDVMDRMCPIVMTNMLQYLPPDEKAALIAGTVIDLQWVLDRAANAWLIPGNQDNQGLQQLMVNSTFNQPDPWIRCLVALVASDESSELCVHAVNSAWTIIYTRLHTLFPLVDPSAQTNEYRSSILRSGSKKVTTDCDVYMHLWHNYAILACCLAQLEAVPPHHHRRCASPDLGASPENLATTTSSSSSSDKAEGGGKQSAQSANLFRLLVPLMKCENPDMRDTVVNGLGYSNPAVSRELQEELVPYLKEINDKKVDNIKQRRRRNNLRAQMTRLFKLMAENGAFGPHNAGVIDPDRNCVNSLLSDYIDGAKLYLEGENERDLPGLHEVRLHFSSFLRLLIDRTPLKQRNTLLSKELRHSLFHLLANWSGRFNPAFERKLLSKDEAVSTVLELATVSAMSAVLCCGQIFDPSGLNEDGYVFNWLDSLLSCRDPEIKDRVLSLSEETVILLLDLNPDVQSMLDWVIDHCYTAPIEVADRCLNALTAVFETKEYSCDLIAMLNLVVLNVGSSRISTHEKALQLLRLLDTYFFQDKPVFEELTATDATQTANTTLNDVLLTVSYAQSQAILSDQLVKLHPDLTMPMFSEITHRFQTARPALRQVLLKCLLPWLHNIELVDPSIPAANAMPSTFLMTGVQEGQAGKGQRSYLEGEGWGSAQATEMVLNNLLYVTVEFGDCHPAEIEVLWAALVVGCWANNLRVVVRYLTIVTNMSPVALLPYAKRVVGYLGRARPEKLVDELMAELQTVETLSQTIERTQTPPFYRLSSLKKAGSAALANTTDDEKLGCSSGSSPHAAESPFLEKGVLHTKRHSTCDEITVVAPTAMEDTPCTDSATFLCSISSVSSSSSGSSSAHDPRAEEGDEVCASPTNSPIPYPLPMPAYGGYFAPMSDLLPDTFAPTVGLHRSYLGVMFLSDLVLDGLDIDWTPHLPLILHIVFLGLDHLRSLVYEHCKNLFLNLLLLGAAVPEHQSVARILVSRMPQLNLLSDTRGVFTADRVAHEKDPSSSSGCVGPAKEPNASTTTTNTNTTAPNALPTIKETGRFEPVETAVENLLDFLEKNAGKPLWHYEDITPKTLSTGSSSALDYFLKLAVRVFEELVPPALVEQRWSQIALQMALSCSSRHYAGRSFQVLRALQVRPSTQMLSDILSRLVETVAEQGDDMQGYVTEIMLTLIASVDNLDLELPRPPTTADVARELFLSTPNLAKEDCLLGLGGEPAKAPPVVSTTSSSSSTSSSYPYPGASTTNQTALPTPATPAYAPAYHTRSTSYTVSVLTSRLTSCISSAGGNNSNPNRFRSPLDLHRSNLAKSHSAQSLTRKGFEEEASAEDKLTIVTQMFWMAVSMLESDYDYEFFLAIELLDKILKHLQPERPECREKLDKILQHIKWQSFPGVQILLLKGCTSHTLAEPTWLLLSRLTLCINAPIVDPTGALGFPINVVSLLPYLVHHYENPGPACREAADRISQMCGRQSEKLHNLATVITLYSRGTFNKDSSQWTKCVVKYLLDVYSCTSLSMITFLVEVLERGPVGYQPDVLQILHCIVHYVDFSTICKKVLNQQLFCPVARHTRGVHWREALKILKLAVTRSSTLAAAFPAGSSDAGVGAGGVGVCAGGALALTGAVAGAGLPGSRSSFVADVGVGIFRKKELPGLTLEFTVDLSNRALIGHKYLGIDLYPKPVASAAEEGSGVGGSRSGNTGGSSNSSGIGSANPNPNLPSIPRKHSSSSGNQDWGGGSGSGWVAGGEPSTTSSSSSSSSSSSWKRPQMSQTRVRERLISLLTYFGQRIGLPKSPSVIFSQSSDHQPPSVATSAGSGGEEGAAGSSSIAETTPPPSSSSTSDALLGDAANSADLMMTFKRFDFLDNELEKDEQNDDDDYFSLGDRCCPTFAALPPFTSSESSAFSFSSSSYSASASGHHNNNKVAAAGRFGSSPELKLQDSIEDLKGIVSTDSGCLLLEVSTSDEESQTPGADEDGMPPRDLLLPSSGASSGSMLPNDPLVERDTSSPVLLVGPSSSSSNEIDLMVLSSSTSRALSVARLGAAYFPIPPDEGWQTHLHQVLTNSNVSLTTVTFLIFPRLYNEHRRCVANLTREACTYIGGEGECLRKLTGKFLHILDTLFVQTECPYIFVKPDTLLDAGLVDRHKFCVLEIQECLDMLNLRLTQAEQSLDTLKSLAALEELRESPLGATAASAVPATTAMTVDDVGGALDDQKGEMCRQLYKLLFQMVLLFESFTKVVDIFQNLSLQGQALDMSGQLVVMRQELRNGLSQLRRRRAGSGGGGGDEVGGEVGDGDVSPPPPLPPPYLDDVRVDSRQDAMACLLEYLQGKEHVATLQLLHHFRYLWPDDVFGACADDDVLALMNIYCSCVSQTTGIFVLVRAELDFGQVYSLLMDVNHLLSSQWPHLVCQIHRSEVTIKPSDSSTF